MTVDLLELRPEAIQAAAGRFQAGVEAPLDAGEPATLRAALGGALTGTGGAAAQPGRSEPCPCGSGRRYERCCGSRAPAA